MKSWTQGLKKQQLTEGLLQTVQLHNYSEKAKFWFDISKLAQKIVESIKILTEPGDKEDDNDRESGLESFLGRKILHRYSYLRPRNENT